MENIVSVRWYVEEKKCKIPQYVLFMENIFFLKEGIFLSFQMDMLVKITINIGGEYWPMSKF